METDDTVLLTDDSQNDLQSSTDGRDHFQNNRNSSDGRGDQKSSDEGGDQELSDEGGDRESSDEKDDEKSSDRGENQGSSNEENGSQNGQEFPDGNEDPGDDLESFTDGRNNSEFHKYKYFLAFKY